MVDNDRRDAARNDGDAFTVHTEADVVRLLVTATLTDEVGRDLRSAVIGFLDEGLRKFIVDLTELDMIVSSGLGFLVSMNALMSSREAKFAIVNTNPNIAGVLQMTRMSSIVTIFGSATEARAGFGA